LQIFLFFIFAFALFFFAKLSRGRARERAPERAKVGDGERGPAGAGCDGVVVLDLRGSVPVSVLFSSSCFFSFFLSGSRVRGRRSRTRGGAPRRGDRDHRGDEPGGDIGGDAPAVEERAPAEREREKRERGKERDEEVRGER